MTNRPTPNDSFQITKQTDFTLDNYGWKILNSSTTGFLSGSLKCKESRLDYKLQISFHNDNASKTINALLDLGKYSVNQLRTITSIYSSVAFQLINTDANKRYDKTSATFSVDKGQIVLFEWMKSSDDGAGNLYITDVSLVID